MKKYCIYFCVFYNAKYIDLLKICLSTLKLSCNLTDIDILILTDAAFIPALNTLKDEIAIQIKWFAKPFSDSIFAAACARLHIFDTDIVPLLKGYEKILYLDTDIIIQKDLSPLFLTEFTNDHICALEESTIANENFGSVFFELSEYEEEKVDWSLKGLNSGILLFYNNANINALFQQTIDDIEYWTGGTKKTENDIPYCLDQPFLSYRVIKENKFERTVLQSWGALFNFNGIPANHEEIAICHFSWPIGNFEHKYLRMHTFSRSLTPLASLE